MATKRVEERFSFTAGTVDRTGTYPIIRDVLLCGAESANGRDYPPRAFAGERIKRYAGKSVYFDHGERPGKSRKFSEKVAWIENPRHNAAGLPLADIGVNPKHKDAESLLWAAEHKKDFCGMSHVANLRYSARDGRETVEEVLEVFSVDIVADPATTKGFFEHKESNMTRCTIKAVAEWVAKHPKSTTEQCLKIKALAEEYGDKETSAPADDAEPGGAIDEAFKALMHAHMDEMIDGSQTIEEFIKKVKALQKAQKGKEAEPKSDDKPGDASTPAESRQRPAVDYDAAIRICSESQFTAAPTELKALATLGTDAERKAYIAERRATGDKPRSSGRTVPPKTEERRQESRLIPSWN